VKTGEANVGGKNGMRSTNGTSFGIEPYGTVKKEGREGDLITWKMEDRRNGFTKDQISNRWVGVGN